MILNAYVKLANTFPELENEVESVFEMHTDHVNPEL